MISNRFYYYFALLTATLILGSCLNSNDNFEYEYSSDAQITSVKISSNQDRLNILPGVKFSIDQVSSAPLIFNKDSLPYLFDVSMISMEINTNQASGIKMHLSSAEGDSTYIWNMTDSVDSKKLKHIEVYAADGRTTKTYTFQLRTHQQDPDTIYWHNVKNDYIDNPTEQTTVANSSRFYTFYKANNKVHLSTSSIEDGESWTNQQLSGLPLNVMLKSIQNEIIDGNETWFALNTDNKVYKSVNGIEWIDSSSAYPVIAILGKMPSLTQKPNASDSVLAVVNHEGIYKFAKTSDFSSLHVLTEIPPGFPIKSFTFTTINKPNIFTAKYLIVTGGKNINNLPNRNVWILQEDESKITHTSKLLKFNVTGSSLFKYDDKIYLMTSENDKNVFYTSSSYGLVWEKTSNKQSLPPEFMKRTNQSVNTDNKNNIWIFGGESSNQTQLVEIWKGRINKLLIK